MGVPAPYLANCVVEFAYYSPSLNSFPATGTTLQNLATTGSAYNGAAYQNDIATMASGAQYWNMLGNASEQVIVTDGTAIQNLRNVTFEILMQYGNATSVYPFCKPTSLSSYGIEPTVTATYTNISHRCSTGSVTWQQTGLTFSVGSWYHMQYSWAMGTQGSASAYPIIGVNGTYYTNGSSGFTEYTTTGNGYAYDTDNGYNLDVGGQVGSNATVEFMVFRLHSAALTQAQMLQNYNADAWRMALHYPYRAGNKLMKICAVG
jgi:hypothetical protein